MAAAVEISDLSKRFGSTEAVRHLSFEVAPGRVTGFLGPNGAGKSTTLRALLGLIHPSGGTATFGGRRYEVDDRGRIVVSTYPERAKAANVARGRTASVVVLSDEFNGAWVQVDGDAELITPPDAVESLVDYFRAISGEHPDWDEYRQAMRDQGKALIRVTPTRWSPIATGGFPPRFAED